MAIKIKINKLTGAWHYEDESGHKSPIKHSKKEPHIDLSKVQLLALEEVELLHIKHIEKTRLIERINLSIDEFLKTNSYFTESDFVEFIRKTLDTEILANSNLLNDVMKPDELASYLSTFTNRITTYFAHKSLSTNNLDTKLYYNKLSNRFYKITAAKVLLFQNQLIQKQIESYKTQISEQLKVIGEDSEKAKKLREKLQKLEDEYKLLEPQVIASELILESTLDETKKNLLNNATLFSQQVLELEDKIRANNEEIARLSTENKDNGDKIAELQEINRLLKNDLLRLSGQIKGLQSANNKKMPSPAAGPTH